MAAKTQEQAPKEHVSRLYEVGYLLVPSLSDEKVNAAVEGVRKIVEGEGGVIVSEEQPVLMDLAYVMSHIDDRKKEVYDSAFFGWMRFETSAGNIQEIDMNLKKESNIIRFLTVKIPKHHAQSRPDISKFAKQQAPEEKETKAVEKPKKEVSDEALDEAINELVN